jgi:hypothetical protein
MIMHTAMSEAIPIPDADIIRRYMSRRELTFQGDMCHMSGEKGVSAEGSGETEVVIANDGSEAVTVRRFLSLDAVRPKRPRRAAASGAR